MTYVKVQNQPGPVEFNFSYREHIIRVKRVGDEHWLAQVFPERPGVTPLFTSMDFKTRGSAIDKALKWVDRNGNNG